MNSNNATKTSTHLPAFERPITYPLIADERIAGPCIMVVELTDTKREFKATFYAAAIGSAHDDIEMAIIDKNTKWLSEVIEKYDTTACEGEYRGFLTNTKRFVFRGEAMKIATNAGQVSAADSRGSQLYSYHLKAVRENTRGSRKK